MIEVYAIQTIIENDFLKFREELISKLPPFSRELLKKYKRTKDKQRSLLGELLTRTILSKKLKIPAEQVIIEKSEKGKPYLVNNNDLHFNISHSGDWVVAAFASTEVGIDIENIKPVNFRIAERFFSKKEFAALEKKAGKEKINFFFDLWTLKESYLKLLGKGLTKSLSSFTVIESNREFSLKENNKDEMNDVFFKQYQIDKDYKLSVCSFSDKFCEELKILNFMEL